MKINAAPKITSYLSECVTCGEELKTEYEEFSQIPADGVGLLCDACARSGNPVSKLPKKQVYYKTCGHKDAPINTMPVLTDLVVINAEKHKKERYKAQCGNCSG